MKESTEKKELMSITLSTNNEITIKNTIINCTDPRKVNLGRKIYIKKIDFDDKIFNNLEEINDDNYRIILMKNLIPNPPFDLIEGKSLLLENNFQNINAIDWNKGCYVGQEITARMKYRALLKKQIYVMEILNGDINSGDQIFYEDAKYGIVISKIENYILCMLKINLAKDKSEKKDTIKIAANTTIKFL